MKKYRMGSYLEKKTMVERRKVVISNTERKQVVQNMAELRDDNSRVIPGKGDYVKVDSVKKLTTVSTTSTSSVFLSRITRYQNITSITPLRLKSKFLIFADIHIRIPMLHFLSRIVIRENLWKAICLYNSVSFKYETL